VRGGHDGSWSPKVGPQHRTAASRAEAFRRDGRRTANGGGPDRDAGIEALLAKTFLGSPAAAILTSGVFYLDAVER
jgi:hypothetical protein